MAKCNVCGKTNVFGNTVSHSGRHVGRQFKANLKKVRVREGQERRRVWVCSRCLRTGVVSKA